MRPSRVSDLVAGKMHRRGFGGRWRRRRSGSAAAVTVAICALTQVLGGSTAHAQLVPLKTFGSPGAGTGQFMTPVGVGIDQRRGAVFVADSANARVEKFDASGKFKLAWGWGVKTGKPKAEACFSKCRPGIPGSGPGQFSNPTSIAVGTAPHSTRGVVYVGDVANNVVSVFGPNGRFKSSIDGSTTPQGGFSALVGVAVDQSNNLWTADGNSDNISEFDAAGNFLQQWTDPFGATVAITVDSTHGFVHLIRGSGETERFTLTGANTGANNSEFVTDPVAGVALGLDPGTGNVFSDHGGDVAVHDPDGNLLQTLSLGTTTNSQGLAFYSQSGGKHGNGQLYVSDAGNDLIAIFGPPPPGPPFISSESVTPAGSTSDILKATIVPAGFDTTCTFQYVDSATFAATGYTNAITVPCTPADLGKGFAFVQASATVNGLSLGTFYHFHAIAMSSAGTTIGDDMTFQAGPGDWTAFFRCPVDDPAMIAADGVNVLPTCIASNSTHGTFSIGPIMTLTGNTNLQFGALLDENTSAFTVIAPPDGAIISDPVQVTVGGITVTAVVESAGTPTNFNLFAGIQLGMPIITLPIKIQLLGGTPDVGPNCTIGSDDDPIILMPETTNLDNAALKFETFNATGAPDPAGLLQLIQVTGAVQGDDTFAVPGAHNCGPNGDGSLDGIVNNLAGLPSPSGNNSLVLDDASSSIAAGLEDGQSFANDWHTGFGF
jgi:hypothetical protein